MSSSKNKQPIPAPLPQSVLLGCNAFNCKSKISNANWTTQLNESVTVNEGDSINIRNSFIDTRGFASNDIIIPADIEISLEYYFYWVHTFNACDGSGLIQAPATPDASSNLTQQVLVGRNIGDLYELNTVLDPSRNIQVPAYYTNNQANFSSTRLNDADGLPYLVYQSTPNFPVPAVYGSIEPAFNIIIGQQYVIHSQGFTTNWGYVGVPDASKNILPVGWVLDQTLFTAMNNPDINLPTSAFLLPTDVEPSLPYVEYVITTLGDDTDWTAIDPTLLGAVIPASSMINGSLYTINTSGNIDWQELGSPSNNPDVSFTYNGVLIPALPIILSNEYFHNFASEYQPDGGSVFGASLSDYFDCTVDCDSNGNWVVTSFYGEGVWINNIGNATWTLTPPMLGLGASTPTATNLLLYGFTTDVVQLITCVADGIGFIQGSAFEGGAVVGTVFKSLFQDPLLPADGGGRANLLSSVNDGTVKLFTPATTRLDIRPVKKKWKMKLKKGSYDPNNLAERISREMTRQRQKRVNKVTGGPFSYLNMQSTLNVPTDSIYNSVTNNGEWVNPTTPSQNTFYDSKNTKVYDYSSQTDYNINPDNDDMPFLFTPAINSTPLHFGNDTLLDYIYYEIPHPNANGLNNLSSPKYFINLVPLISDVRSVSPTLPSASQIQQDGYYSILPFYSNNGVTQGDINTGLSGLFPITFGATQSSLIYNDENNSLFSFNYLHTPILAFLESTSSDLTECTAHMYTTQKKSSNMTPTNFFTTLIDKKSGILLNKMQPESFWEQLGFNIPSMTVDLDPKNDAELSNPTIQGFKMTLNEFNNKTTGGFSGSSDIYNPIFHTAKSADQPCIPDTELMYMVCTPTTVQQINAISTIQGLSVGTEYLITKNGELENKYTGQPDGAMTDWTYCGGLNPMGPGDTFIANSTGFPDQFGDATIWTYGEYPFVIPFVSSTSTTTQLQNTYFTVESTNSILAESIPTQRDATGHYLLEIVAFPSIYLDDNNKREIKSVISTFYVSSGSFVSNFPDSYYYFHIGAPIQISQLKIRILNPFDMLEANIGPNSSVYVQINKQLTDEAVAQLEN